MRRTLSQAIILTLFFTGRAFAETAAPAPADSQFPRRSAPVPELASPVSDRPPQGSLATPAVQPPARTQKLSSTPRFVLRDIRLEGNTVLDEPSIRETVAPYIGRQVSTADLDDIRRQLTLLYVNHGYINSGVLIPDQNVADGFVTFRAVEGHVSGMEITGTQRFNPDYFTARLSQGLSNPFNISDLEREQKILLQDPLVSRLNIELLPSPVPGEARAHVDLLEASPYSVVAQIANSQSPTVGEIRGQLQGTAANLWGVGDILSAQYGRTQGINDGSIGYSLPIASDDTRVNLRYDINGTLVVTPALSPIHITSTYNSLALGVSRPFYRTPEQNLTFGTGLEWRQARTFLLNQPFSFTAGSSNGNTNVTVLRTYGDYLDRDAEHAFALRTTLSVGLHALGATVTNTPPTGKFVAGLIQGQYVRRVYEDWEGVLRASLQASDKALFPIEQFALGGIDTVRGYRQFLTVTDDAFFGSAELRIPIFNVRVPRLADTDQAGTVQLVPFYDYGQGWNVGRPTPYPPDISGVGAGLRWIVGSGITAEIYYAKALRHIRAGTSLEDRGIYFRLTAKAF